MIKIKVGSKKIGEGEPAFIIAEAGSNHNGRIEQAKKLIDVAVEAGADAVKFQLFRAEKLYPQNAGHADYLKTKKSIYRIIKEMEMPYDWIPELYDYCRERSIIFLASHFDEESADKLEEVCVDAYKIASYECTHIPLLRYTAKKGKPIIMSTGLASLGEIEESLNVIYAQGNSQVALMHCAAAYPTPIEHVNLRVMDTLKTAFEVPVGISDHTRDPILVPIVAVARGANIIEKHFTLSNKLEGPDHRFAIEPHELKAMVKSIRMTEKALGSPHKHVMPSEKELYKFARRRIHAIRDIKKGEIITSKNAAILRSGKLPPGAEPKFWDLILGKKAAKNIAIGEGITLDKVNFSKE
jgi:N-acetylneuraminate synthase